MENPNILAQAREIAVGARERARHADIESAVTEFESSDSRPLRSLARVYRMLQWPTR